MRHEMWQDTNFSTADLMRLTQIGTSPTDNEKFLLDVIDKFFVKVALLQDDIETLQRSLEDAGGIA